MPHAIFVDPNPQNLSAAIQLTEKHGFTVCITKTLQEVAQLHEHFVPDIAIINAELSDGSGLELLKKNHWGAATQFLMIMPTISLTGVVESFRLQANDIFLHPLDLNEFNRALTKIVQARGLYRYPIKKYAKHAGKFGRLIGKSQAMQHVYHLIERVAATNATVLISGESGTGKDLVAQTLHDYSQRDSNAFIAINCGAISTDLIGSALFGHEKGSFTGAQQPHKGYFEQASGGTLFLDEITETHSELQVQLLRVLETNTVIPVGGQRQIGINSRVIAATNRIPEEAVRAGALREDLYYRLNTFPIHLPPLRDRGNDISLLTEFFLEQLNQENQQAKIIHPSALALLQMWTWPGNIRELKNVIQRAFILTDHEIQPHHISFKHSLVDQNSNAKSRIKIGTPLALATQQFINKTWQYCNKNSLLTRQLLHIEQPLLEKVLK